MNLSREQSKLKHFVDLKDGPSTLQKRPDQPTMKEKNKTPTVYESERSNHIKSTNQNMETLKDIRSALFD